MKIYSKIVIAMDTLEVISEESYDYQGPVVECKSGGAGGGSPAGSLAYPAYMQEAHANWLNGGTGASLGARDVLSISVAGAMNAAMQGDSPFKGFEVVDTNKAFLGQYKTLSSYVSPYERIADLGCFNPDGAFADYITDDNAKITAAIVAESDALDTEIMTKIMPKFHAGMVEANAVASDAFVLGEALIWGMKVQAIAKSDAVIRLDRLNSQADIALKRVGVNLEFRRLTASLSAEITRMYTAARHDIDGFTAELAAKDKLFDLTVFQYGTNVMSSIHGSAISPPDPGSGKTGTGGALSGALSGAALGAMYGSTVPGIGTAVGAVGGAVLGLAASYM
jgi:hypothetical protein